jgi:hypothetical protein
LCGACRYPQRRALPVRGIPTDAWIEHEASGLLKGLVDTEDAYQAEARFDDAGTHPRRWLTRR